MISVYFILLCDLVCRIPEVLINGVRAYHAVSQIQLMHGFTICPFSDPRQGREFGEQNPNKPTMLSS